MPPMPGCPAAVSRVAINRRVRGTNLDPRKTRHPGGASERCGLPGSSLCSMVGSGRLAAAPCSMRSVFATKRLIRVTSDFRIATALNKTAPEFGTEFIINRL